jgi:HD-GYP domain-containing protein (c-di-GMP phosphodiesterase class II)
MLQAVQAGTMSRISRIRPVAQRGPAASPGPFDPGAYHDAALEAFARRAIASDPEGPDHPMRVGRIAGLLGGALGLARQDRAVLERAAALHDVGKALLPPGVLGRARSLGRGARRVMESHTTLGAGILARGAAPWLRLGAVVALGHHERWDGSGYPAGLAGEAVPLAARIVAVADVYDALRSERAYKEAQHHEEALARLVEGDERMSPGQFDPAVLRALARVAPLLAAMPR